MFHNIMEKQIQRLNLLNGKESLLKRDEYDLKTYIESFKVIKDNNIRVRLSWRGLHGYKENNGFYEWVLVLSNENKSVSVELTHVHPNGLKSLVRKLVGKLCV